VSASVISHPSSCRGDFQEIASSHHTFVPINHWRLPIV